MNRMKRVAAAALAGAMLLVGTVPAALASDITGHWAEPYMNYMNEHGIIKPSTSGNFTPSATISRAEFMRYINRAFGFTKKADIAKYTDVAKDKWYYETVQIAVEYGYISGTSDKTMGPESPITREQVTAILGRLSKKTYPAASADSLKFKDKSKIAAWCLPYVSAMVENSVLVGDTNNNFRPKDSITRAEIARILYAYLGTVMDTQDGTYSALNLREDASGATVTKPVTIVDASIPGDVYISEALGDKDKVLLANVNIIGDLVIAGGEVELRNVQAESILISSPFGTPLTVYALDNTAVEKTEAITVTALEVQEGSDFGQVSGKASLGKVTDPQPAPDPTPADPNGTTVTPVAASFDRYEKADGYRDLELTIKTAEGDALRGVMLGSTALSEGSGYTYDAVNGKVTIPAGRLAACEPGKATVTCMMTSGNNPSVSVTISDSTPASVLSPTSMTFCATEGAVYYRDITVWMNSAAGISLQKLYAGQDILREGSDFLVVGNRVVLFREALAAHKANIGSAVDYLFLMSDGSAPTMRVNYI